MKLCDYSKSILEILQRPQVSVLRTSGPLVLLIPGHNNIFLLNKCLNTVLCQVTRTFDLTQIPKVLLH